jgi:hypothetical protein
MNIKRYFNMGDREIDEEAVKFILEQRLKGSRKSAVKSMLLEGGYSKETMKKHFDGLWEASKEAKETERGKELVSSYNREKVNNGFKFLVMSLVIFVIEYVLYYFFDFRTPVIFFIFVLPSIYYIFRGVTGL